MAFKDIIGTVFSVKDDEPVFSALETLAAGKQHATAVLIGLQPDPIYSMEAVPVWSDILERQRADFEEEKQKLDIRAAARSGAMETRALLVSASLAGAEAVMQARLGDLTVMLRPAGAWPEDYRNTLFEAVLFGSGRPVLLIPPNWRGGAIGRNIVIGWNGKREAARAIADAMPLLETADMVMLATVEVRPSPDDCRETAGADMIAHLARHSVSATPRIIDSLGRDEGDALLTTARGVEADLIVIGGYGKARLREWVFGGVTRALTHASDIPVLLSH